MAEGGELHLASPYRLPQGCNADERPAWDPVGARWNCAPAGSGADTLGGLSCVSGQVAKWDGMAWSCADDADSVAQAGAGLVGEGGALHVAPPYQLPQGYEGGALPRWNGSGWSCSFDVDTNSDTLAALDCFPGAVAKWDGSQWSCALDDDTAMAAGRGLERTGRELALAPGFALPEGCNEGQLPRWNGTAWGCSAEVDTNTDTLAALSCAAGQVPSWNGAGWTCVAPEANTDTLAALDCSEGQVPAWNGIHWACAAVDPNTDTLASLGCFAGEVPRWDGTSWACAASVEAGTGLQRHGDVLSLDAAHRLPQDCGADQVPTWNGQGWTCAPKGTITGVAAGTGLQGGGEAGVASLGLDLGFTDTRYQRRYGKTVVVSPAADPQASGAALLAAVAGLTASQTAPVLVRLEPGTYELASATLDLPPWVSVEGAGPLLSVVRGFGAALIRIGTSETRTELRSLSLVHTTTGAGTTISFRGRELRLVNVEIQADGVQEIRMVDASRIQGSGDGADAARLVLQGSHLRAGEGAVGIGLGAQVTYGVDGDDVSVHASTIRTKGLLHTQSLMARSRLRFVASEASAECGEVWAGCSTVGLYVIGAGQVQASSVTSRRAAAFGVLAASHDGMALLRIEASQIDVSGGPDAVAIVGQSRARVAASMVQGPASGDVRCIGSYDATHRPLGTDCE